MLGPGGDAAEWWRQYAQPALDRAESASGCGRLSGDVHQCAMVYQWRLKALGFSYEI